MFRTHRIEVMRFLCIATFFLSCLFDSVRAQPHIRVSGRSIIGPCGDTLLLKGINYSPYNWGWSANQLRISELAKTKANSVRLVWYKTGESGTPSTTYSNLVLLDSALSKCIQAGLIPILELHDQTCQNSPQSLIDLSSWFAQPVVLQLILKYQHSLILNVANEALYVNWTANPLAAKATFLNTYSLIVGNLRTSGIHVPLMIDGPDCGTNLDVLTEVGPVLLTSDQDSNLIFSAHAYWFSYAGNDSTQMAAKIGQAVSANIPFLFGEVANLQDDQVNCQYALNFKPLLRICKLYKIGWLAWSWDNDVCPARQISVNGQFSTLTSYGQDLMFHPDFGLTTDSAKKSIYLMGGICAQTPVGQSISEVEIVVYPSPNQGSFRYFHSKGTGLVFITNVLGQEVPFHSEPSSVIRLSGTKSTGIHFLHFSNGYVRRIQVE